MILWWCSTTGVLRARDRPLNMRRPSISIASTVSGSISEGIGMRPVTLCAACFVGPKMPDTEITRYALYVPNDRYKSWKNLFAVDLTGDWSIQMAGDVLAGRTRLAGQWHFYRPKSLHRRLRTTDLIQYWAVVRDWGPSGRANSKILYFYFDFNFSLIFSLSLSLSLESINWQGKKKNLYIYTLKSDSHLFQLAIVNVEWMNVSLLVCFFILCCSYIVVVPFLRTRSYR